jgi:hypothetical protein
MLLTLLFLHALHVVGASSPQNGASTGEPILKSWLFKGVSVGTFHASLFVRQGCGKIGSQ